MTDLTMQLGFLPEMSGMVKTFDRDDHPGLVTGDRARYRTKIKGRCERCGGLTDQVIDYLGRLSFWCGWTCPKVWSRS